MKHPMKHLMLLFAASLLISGTSLATTLGANNKFVVEGEILHYNTDLATDEEAQEITEDDIDYFKKILDENAEIAVVYLTSWGGLSESAYKIADLIIDYDLNTHVVGICYSACTLVSLAGNKRTLAKDSKIGFHRGWWDPASMREYYEAEKEIVGWSDIFDFSSWIFEFAQEDMYKDFKFLLERNVDPLFAIETVKAAPEDGWYPRRKELLEANFLTE